jgi:hypothetical protein
MKDFDLKKEILEKIDDENFVRFILNKTLEITAEKDISNLSSKEICKLSLLAVCAKGITNKPDKSFKYHVINNVLLLCDSLNLKTEITNKIFKSGEEIQNSCMEIVDELKEDAENLSIVSLVTSLAFLISKSKDKTAIKYMKATVLLLALEVLFDNNFNISDNAS